MPIPILLGAMVAFWAADWQGSHESAHLLLALNLVSSTLVCLFVAYLIARSFLVRATPGLLLLGCGVVIWGPAGVVATAAARGDANISITIYNGCVWLSGLCHLAGVSLSLRPRRSLSPPALWLPAAYVLAAGAVILVALSALAGWIPTFFVEERGGTLVRQVVLASAIIMFVLTAWLLGTGSRRSLSAFAYWYALALTLIAVGLFGVQLQRYYASVLGWTGRATQSLGGLYMLIAALASVRESRVWGISLEAALQQSEERYRTLVETAPDAIVVHRDGRFLYANSAALLLAGADSFEQLARHRVLDFIPPAQREQVVERVRTAMAGGRLPAREATLLRLDGQEVPVEFHTAPVDFQGARAVQAIIRDVTARKQAEEQLRRSREMYRAIVEDQTEFVTRFLPGGEVIFMNEASLAYFHKKKEDVYGKSFLPMVPKEEWARLKREIGKVSRENPVVSLEHSVIDGNGRVRVHHWINRAIFDRDGRVVEIQGVGRDITERKRAEEASKIKESAIASSLNAIAIADLEGHLTYVNPAFVKLWGYQDEHEVLGKPVLDFWKEPEQAVAVIQAIRNGGGWIGELVAVRKDGGCQSLYLSASTVLNDTGTPICMMGSFTDISERKRAEEALRVSESATRDQAARLATVLEATPAIIWIAHDRDCRSITGNRAAREFSRVPDSSVNLSKTGPAPERLAHYRIFANGVELSPPDMPMQAVARSGRELRDHAIEFRFDDGTRRSLVGNVIPLFDARGRPSGTIAAFLDVTEHKRAEEALRELNVTLESKVADRTAQLAYRAKQLQKLTLELSQAEDRERRRIAALLHEDVQQQIAGAKFHLSLLRSRGKDDPQQATLDKVDELLREAIEKSRNLSYDLSPAALNMNDLAEVLRCLAREMWAKQGLTVHLDIPRDTTRQSEALTMFLFRAAQEMLFNVIKHAQVNVAALRVHRIGRCLCLSVSDRGCGFDPQDLKESSGFGLLSIRERVGLLGGRMKIKSARGQGTRFHLVVPDGDEAGD